MRCRRHLEQARSRFTPLQACDRSVGRPLGAGQTSGPKCSLRNARITPPCETTTMREPRGWRARIDEGHFEPRDDLLVRFGADERPAFLLGDREELLCQLGVALLLLGPGVTFEDASIPLAQAVDGDDLARESRTITDDLCGLESARERARVEALEWLTGEAASCQASLHPPSPSGNSIWPCQMPFAFAVDCP